MSKKHAIAGLAIVFGICAAILLSSVLFPPRSGKTPEKIMEEHPKEEISTEALQIQALTRRIEATEENIKKIYNNQVEINNAITGLLKNEEASKKTNKENRAYIAMMYQKLLDVELRMENVGGGFNVKQKTAEDQINPLIGTDTLPAP